MHYVILPLHKKTLICKPMKHGLARRRKTNVSPEAANRGVLWKKVFLEILENSQENTCATVSFLTKLQASGMQLY